MRHLNREASCVDFMVSRAPSGTCLGLCGCFAAVHNHDRKQDHAGCFIAEPAVPAADNLDKEIKGIARSGVRFLRVPNERCGARPVDKANSFFDFITREAAEPAFQTWSLLQRQMCPR